MGNNVHNDTLIRGPESDLDKIAKEMGSCGSLTIERKSKHCLRIRNSIRQSCLWEHNLQMLKEYKQCWIRTIFTEEMNGGAGIWIGFYLGDKEIIQSRYWGELCIEEWDRYSSEKRYTRSQMSEDPIPRAPPTNVTNVVTNTFESVGIDMNFLHDITSCPVWDIKDHSCKTSNQPLTEELIPFLKDCPFLKNYYCDETGKAGVWIGANGKELEHHEWLELSKEEIASFETAGTNMFIDSDKYTLAYPKEWYVGEMNRLCATKGDKILNVWFATC